MTQHVVVGYDGSDHAGVAVDWAATEAVSRGARLTLLAATTVATSAIGGRFGVTVSPSALDDLLQPFTSQVEARAEEVRVSHPGLTVDARVVLGSPAFALVEESEDADLVVVGSRGLGGFRGLLLGSVGTQVATHATCPAVVIRQAPSPASNVVTVGVDGSEISLSALDFAFDMADRHGWGVRAVHARQLPTLNVMAAPMSPPPIDVDVVETDGRLALAQSLAGLREQHPGVAVEEHILQGSPVRALLEASADAALLVLGSRGRGEFVGAVLGSVSQGVLHRATIPVAVIGPSPQAGE